jgi:ABC-type polysaccharide/polyol phosphate transport system ATPase subunit
VISASPAISVTDAGKRYVKYEDQPMLVTAALRVRPRTRRSSLWALRHVTFDVAQGECLGVIGRNGSGKSTLLQMLAGVTAPTEGRVAVAGRISPLMVVGVGFHPELTGRENVYVNGTILGLQRDEIDERFDSIVAFSELPDFIDTPVKFYSSGMYVRLAFSVAITAQPDVLLVDEVLAVGDIGFQMKCFDRMIRIRERGATLVVVSHNLNAIRRMCDRSLLLDGGQVRFDGPSDQAISRYHELMREWREPEAEPVPGELRLVQKVIIESLHVYDASGAPTRQFNAGDEMTVRLHLRFQHAVDHPILRIAITSESGIRVYGDIAPEGLLGSYAAGEQVCFEVAMNLDLGTGSYELTVSLQERDLLTVVAWSQPVLFWVKGRDLVTGVADLGAVMRVAERQRT